MTLDELIEALETFRRQCPGAGTAEVGELVDRGLAPEYTRGFVWLTQDGSFDDD